MAEMMRPSSGTREICKLEWIPFRVGVSNDEVAYFLATRVHARNHQTIIPNRFLEVTHFR